MLAVTDFLLATFTAPEEVCMNPQSLLWFLPLAAAISVIYKATKLPEIKMLNFIKESSLLFGSVVVFIIVIAIVLNILAWFISY